MANKKQEKQVLIRQPTLPLFSVPCLISFYTYIIFDPHQPRDRNEYFSEHKLKG